MWKLTEGEILICHLPYYYYSFCAPNLRIGMATNEIEKNLISGETIKVVEITLTKQTTSPPPLLQHYPPPPLFFPLSHTTTTPHPHKKEPYWTNNIVLCEIRLHAAKAIALSRGFVILGLPSVIVSDIIKLVTFLRSCVLLHKSIFCFYRIELHLSKQSLTAIITYQTTIQIHSEKTYERYLYKLCSVPSHACIDFNLFNNIIQEYSN